MSAAIHPNDPWSIVQGDEDGNAMAVDGRYRRINARCETLLARYRAEKLAGTPPDLALMRAQIAAGARDTTAQIRALVATLVRADSGLSHEAACGIARRVILRTNRRGVCV